MLSGYLHKNYAESLAEFGTPVKLSHSDGWLLKRNITGYSYFDAMGCYPIFSCRDWSKLNIDINKLNTELVSISLVTDPFGNYNLPYLQKCFPEKAIPFKKHFIIDLKKEMGEYISPHHQRNAKKAIKNIHVEKIDNPGDVLDKWFELYLVLIERHKIKGISAFSKSSFEKQLATPGIIVFSAIVQNETVGMLLWFVQGEIAYYHLGAYSELGYQLNASFALFWESIKYFKKSKLMWMNLGAGAGLNSDETDGLTRFKKGWATETRLAYFCGKILDRDKYAMLTKNINNIDSKYFPAYRNGEFG